MGARWRSDFRAGEASHGSSAQSEREEDRAVAQGEWRSSELRVKKLEGRCVRCSCFAVVVQVATESTRDLGASVAGKQHKNLESRTVRESGRMMGKPVDNISIEKWAVKLPGLPFKGGRRQVSIVKVSGMLEQGRLPGVSLPCPRKYRAYYLERFF